jgi:hypothetical protein
MKTTCMKGTEGIILELVEARGLTNMYSVS